MDQTTRDYYIRLNYQAGGAAQTAQADLTAIGRAGTQAGEAVAAGLSKADKQAEQLGNRLQAVQDRIALSQSKLQALQTRINQIVPPNVPKFGGFSDPDGKEAAAFTRLTLAAEKLELQMSRDRIVAGQMERDLRALGTAAATNAGALDKTAAAAQNVGQKSSQAGSLMAGFASRMVSTAAGIAAYQALNLVVQGLSAIGKELVQAPQQMETWLVTYVQLTGDAAVAQQRLNETIKQSATATQSVQEFVALDQALLTAGITAETAAQRFGRSLPQIRQAISDAAAARPDIGLTRFSDLFVRLQEGSSRAARSIRDMGIASTDELAALGVQFNRTGTEMTSGADVNSRAILTLFEQRFGGIGKAQAQTTAGMLQNLQDYFFGAAGILGQPINNALHEGLRSFLADLQKAREDGSLERWADDIDRFFNAVGTTLGLIGGLLAPVADLIGGVLDILAQMFPATTRATDAAAAATSGYAGALRDAASAGEAAARAQETQNAAFAEALTAQGKVLDGQKREWDTYYQELMTAAREAGTALTRQAEDARAAADAANKPLRDKIALMDRLRSAASQERDIARLREKIRQDENLAPDLYSAAGASARARLQDEKDRLADLLDQRAGTQEKNRLQDAIAANDAGRDKTLAGIQAAQRANEDYQRGLQAAQRAQDEIIQQDKDLIQQTLDGLRQNTDWWNRNNTAAGDVGTAVDGVTGSIYGANTAAGALNTTFGQTQSAVTTINGQLDDTQRKLLALNGGSTAPPGGKADGGWSRDPTIQAVTGGVRSVIAPPVGSPMRKGILEALQEEMNIISTPRTDERGVYLADQRAAAANRADERQAYVQAQRAAAAAQAAQSADDPTDRRGHKAVFERNAAANAAAAQVAAQAAQVQATLATLPGYVPIARPPGAGTRPPGAPVPRPPPATPAPGYSSGTGAAPAPGGAGGEYTVYIRAADDKTLLGQFKALVHQNRLYITQELATVRPGGR